MNVHVPCLTEAELRNALYSGELIRIPATRSSQRLVAAVLQALVHEFGSTTPIRRVQFDLTGEELFQRIGRVRKLLCAGGEYREQLFELLKEQGLARELNAVDPIRLRAVAHLGHENPLAAPAYTAHRDTWYANPQAQLNWWIPLHDVGPAETFAFYPDYFEKEVANNSADFDYDDWIAKVGWQNTDGKQAVYPAASGDAFNRAGAVAFSANAGDIILFSAAHLHQTTENKSGLTRFSIDFRTVNLDDHSNGRGAPNVDNQSRGSALKDYLV